MKRRIHQNERLSGLQPRHPEIGARLVTRFVPSTARQREAVLGSIKDYPLRGAAASLTEPARNLSSRRVLGKKWGTDHRNAATPKFCVNFGTRLVPLVVRPDRPLSGDCVRCSDRWQERPSRQHEGRRRDCSTHCYRNPSCTQSAQRLIWSANRSMASVAAAQPTLVPVDGEGDMTMS